MAEPRAGEVNDPGPVTVNLVGGRVVRGRLTPIDTEDQRLDRWGAANDALVRREGDRIIYAHGERRVVLPRIT